LWLTLLLKRALIEWLYSLAMAALNKAVHRNNRRKQDVVITAEHPKGLSPSWHGLVIQFSK